MKKQTRGQTLEDIGGFVTIHVAMPPKLMKWAVGHAREQGHKDVSQVIHSGLHCLMASHRAKSTPA
jgi:hypothetical protein